MEVMLVLLILVIIGSVAGVAVIRFQRNAYIDASRAQISAFDTPLQTYRLDVGDFPASADGLQALRTIPSGLASPTKWRGPYLAKEVPKDPWDNDYRYEYPGKYDPEMPDIWSYGPDQIDGTDDDIGSWPQVKQ
jgi:general secretion pathway protein G